MCSSSESMERNRERKSSSQSSWPYMGIALYYIDIALAISVKMMREFTSPLTHTHIRIDLSNEWLIEHTSYKHVHIIDLYGHTSYI